MRRRERRLRSMLRHEQQTVRMALAAFTQQRTAPEDDQGQGGEARGGAQRAKVTVYDISSSNRVYGILTWHHFCSACASE